MLVGSVTLLLVSVMLVIGSCRWSRAIRGLPPVIETEPAKDGSVGKDARVPKVSSPAKPDLTLPNPGAAPERALLWAVSLLGVIGAFCMLGGGLLIAKGRLTLGIGLLFGGALCIPMSLAILRYSRAIAIGGFVFLAVVAAIVLLLFVRIGIEVIHTAEKAKQELTPEAMAKIFGDGGVADQVQSAMTRAFVAKVRGK
jgi:hypothetical protein